MNCLVLPDDPSRGLAFYLAAEEFAAMEGNWDEAFFVWSVPPTAIIGRNQDIYSEVNLEYCRESGVDVVRRKSGGGCVYADKGNLMISYITRRGDVQGVFGRYLDRLVEALASLGIKAERSGRNDVLVDGCKVSGNAFRMLPDRCVVHGTLLYDVDFAAMEKAITPSGVKLASKGVASVRSRVANLKGFLEEAGHGNMDVRALKTWLTDFFCDRQTGLSDSQVHEIEEIEKTYRELSFLYGRRSDGAIRFSGHIPGVGEICLSLVSDGERRIVGVHVSGDYFLMDGMTPEMVDRAFTERFRGCPLVEDEIAARLENMDLGSMIHIINGYNGRKSQDLPV